MESDVAPLIPHSTVLSPTHEITRYRWVILLLFSFLFYLQSGIWDTWGPISVSATKVIGFTDHDYDLLSNWGTIGVLTTMPFFIWLMNKKGARLPMVIGCFLVAIGAGLRCLPLEGVPRKYAIHVGQIFNSFAGCVVLGAGPLISNTWFPPQERILATSGMMGIGNLGNALSFLIGPAIVDRPNNCSNASTNAFPIFPANSTTLGQYSTGCTNNTDEIRKQIDYYLYAEFALAVLLFVLVLVFFRNKPALPPSVTAATERLDILAGLKDLSKNISYWAVTISYSAVEGAYFGWYGISTVLLTPHGLSESEVGLAAFIMTVVGTVICIAVGWFGDRMKGRLKWILFSCYCVMFLFFLYLVIIIMDWIQVEPFIFTRAGFWVSYLIFGAVGNVLQPIGMELAADIAYPVSEGTSTSILAWVTMLFMFIFLLVLNAVTNQDIANYLLLAFIGVSAPVLAVMTKNRNVRLEVDEKIDEEASSKTPAN